MIAECDTLPMKLRLQIRRIAQEDHTTFATTLRSYVRMKKWLMAEFRNIRTNNKKYPSQKPIDASEEVKNVESRIINMRSTLRINLAEALRLFSEDPPADGGTPKPAMRMCTKPGCKKPCTIDSWYFCWNHMILHDDLPGDLIYAGTPPKNIYPAMGLKRPDKDGSDGLE